MSARDDRARGRPADAPAKVRRRLDELAARFGLPPGAADRLGILVSRLTRDPLAPTSIRDAIAAVDDHIADSLVALELAVVAEARTIADLGSGAGLPAVPLAIALPDAEVTAVESTARKCAFIASVAQACGTANLAVANVRAESWPDGLARSDVVTARALAPLDVVAEYAAPLLKVGGALVAWRGRRDPESESAAARAADRLGLAVGDVREVSPYPGAIHRHLHVMLKTAPTPAGFPRRAGMARKRPLGSLATTSDRDRR